MATIHSRREFLGLISGAGAGLALGQAAHAEPPPETTALRLGRIAGVCLAPQYFAEALLRAEGLPAFAMSRRRPASPFHGCLQAGKSISR